MLSEENLKDAYWGYIYLKRDNSFSYKIRNGTSIGLAFGATKEVISTLFQLLLLPRNSLRCKGKISWHHLGGDELCLYGMFTRKDSTLSDASKLYEEFERIAKLKGLDTVYTVVTKRIFGREITDTVMIRLGWESVEGDTLGMYRKCIS